MSVVPATRPNVGKTIDEQRHGDFHTASAVVVVVVCLLFLLIINQSFLQHKHMHLQLIKKPTDMEELHLHCYPLVVVELKLFLLHAVHLD